MSRIDKPEQIFQDAATANANRDYARAAQLYEHLAQNGHPYALVHLAQMHIEGTGTEVDLDKALQLLDRAEKMGEAEALIQKGRIFLARNDARRYFTSVQHAAGSGLLPSQYQLAVCYLLGVGTEKDLTKGLEAMRQAADSGHLIAKSYLAKRQIARPWNLVGFVHGLATFFAVLVQGLLLHLTKPGDPRIR